MLCRFSVQLLLYLLCIVSSLKCYPAGVVLPVRFGEVVVL